MTQTIIANPSFPAFYNNSTQNSGMLKHTWKNKHLYIFFFKSHKLKQIDSHDLNPDIDLQLI